MEEGELKMKSLNNLNTLDAMIREEKMGYKEYAQMADSKDVPPKMRAILKQMSLDEKRHHDNLVKYRMYLLKKRG